LTYRNPFSPLYLYHAQNLLAKLFIHATKLQNIKNKFHPTIIAVDFIEKDSEVFLCYEDQNCSGRKCNLPTDVSSAWSLEKVAIVGTVSIGVISYCYLMGCCGNQNDQHFHAD
jgi:hypothetical protein